jgi:hypothetical protein
MENKENIEKNIVLNENEKKLTKENFPKEIEIKFITTTYSEKVTETPFKVPSEITR